MDSRRYEHKWYESADERRMLFVVRFQLEDEDEDAMVEIPAHYEVCETCSGRGTHVNPNIDENGLSADDFDQDPDFYESYMSGMYDVTCQHCHGKRVAMCPNFDAMSPTIAKRVEQLIQDYYEDQRSDYEIRRMENGGYDY